MSVSRKHYYRFIYLKSEEWKTLRLEKLASANGTCARCQKQDPCNDVHHLNYRNLHDVELSDLLVLCRPCHELVHKYLDALRDGELEKRGKPRAWKAFLSMWGPRPDQTPELRKLIVAIRRKGMMEDTKRKVIGRGEEAITVVPKDCTMLKVISVSLARSRFQKIKALASQKGWSVEEFVFQAVCKFQTRMEGESEADKLRKFMAGLPNAENILTARQN